MLLQWPSEWGMPKQHQEHSFFQMPKQGTKFKIFQVNSPTTGSGEVTCPVFFTRKGCSALLFVSTQNEARTVRLELIMLKARIHLRSSEQWNAHCSSGTQKSWAVSKLVRRSPHRRGREEVARGKESGVKRLEGPSSFGCEHPATILGWGTTIGMWGCLSISRLCPTSLGCSKNIWSILWEVVMNPWKKRNIVN